MSYEFDPYSILGVSSEASVEEIKSAYRRIARRLHPDSNPNNPGAALQFQDVTAAHELLLDPDERRKYDKARAEKAQEDNMEFRLRVTPSKRSVTTLGETQVIYLLAEVFPDQRAQNDTQNRETSINLALVLDQSNSMNGARMEKVKVAAHHIIDNLAERDVLSVVVFNDRATVIIPATQVVDKPALKARISMMTAAGGTEIYQGLVAGVNQNRQFYDPRMVNHVILLTDGHTYGDQDRCLELADEAAHEGIGISAMGLGHDWNDTFLDMIATRTGGSSMYVNSPQAVIQYLNDHVRHLSNAFAERMHLSIAPDPDVELELTFKLSPHPQPLESTGDTIPLGALQPNRPISVLMQYQMPANMPAGFRSVARLVVTGDILANLQQKFQALSDISIEVTEENIPEEPPAAILDALSKLTLYRLQERAQDALVKGDIVEATRRLENLATRFLEMGEEDLANQALAEARRVAHTNALSEKGRKDLKYKTRSLILSTTGLGTALFLPDSNE